MATDRSIAAGNFTNNNDNFEERDERMRKSWASPDIVNVHN
jgi:hypothetical protein